MGGTHDFDDKKFSEQFSDFWPKIQGGVHDLKIFDQNFDFRIAVRERGATIQKVLEVPRLLLSKHPIGASGNVWCTQRPPNFRKSTIWPTIGHFIPLALRAQKSEILIAFGPFGPKSTQNFVKTAADTKLLNFKEKPWLIKSHAFQLRGILKRASSQTCSLT